MKVLPRFQREEREMTKTDLCKEKTAKFWKRGKEKLSAFRGEENDTYYR